MPELSSPRSLIALRIVALVCLFSLVQFHVREIATASIQYDDAHNANVAKNLAFGFGYSTSYHEIVPFNPEATTGPVVLLPAAAFVRLFGNRYWVPTFAIVVCLWSAIALLFILLRGMLVPRAWWIAVALVSFGLSLYDADEFGLLGDVPAALLAGSSILVLCNSTKGTNRILAAGLLLGIAIQAKLLVALVLPASLLYLIVAPGDIVRADRVRSVARYCAGVALPSVLWQLFQLVSLGSVHRWVELNARQVAFIRTWSGVGIVRSGGLAAALSHQLSLHAVSLLEDFHGAASLILFPVALIAAVGLLFSRPASTSDRSEMLLRSSVLVLMGAAFTHVVWWLLFDTEGWYRHLLPAVVYLLIASSAAASTVAVSRKAGAAAVVLLLLSWTPQLPNLKLIYRSFEREARLAALLSARDEMIELQQNPDTVFVGYGWWVPRDLEYLLPTVGNFKDGLRLQAGDVAGKKIVLVRNEFYNRLGSAYERAYQVACDRRILFRRDPFVISLCPSLPRDLSGAGAGGD